MKTGVVWLLLTMVGLASWGIWRYWDLRTPHITNLQITTSSPPAGKNVTREQRLKFAQEYEKIFHGKGMEAKITTKGEGETSIIIAGKVVSTPTVVKMKDNVDAVSDLRDMGFKTLIMTNGKDTWIVGLRN